ncbi:hypothetical protein BT96DRAFT_1077539 [Gymnopus androsaceus JB14]|uniref:Uncharacterized protein n=1 Tax=Gymnopus androsaceus JB14 TaxID=1447944 RepID=A0A6A4IMG5_9AGAR|nr:hypothetical protein BT96DRAFT_1077539 [Gymnopus androsaceus JB14]
MRSLPSFKIIPPGHTFVAYNELFLTSIRAKRLQNELYTDLYEFEGVPPKVDLAEYPTVATFALVEEYFERIMKAIDNKQWDELWTSNIALTFKTFPVSNTSFDIPSTIGITSWTTNLIWPWQEFHLDNSSSDAKVVPYIDVCRAIAWKLFKDQTEEDRALHLAFVEEWLEWLEPTEEDFGYSEWIRKWLEDNWRWLRLGTQDAWYNAGKDVVSVELSEYQDLDLQKTWAEFSEHKRENPLVPPKGSSWEVMDWNDVGCKVRLRSKSYSEDDTDEEEDGTEEEGSDTESMGWGGERPFWRM